MVFDVMKLRLQISFRNAESTRELVFHVAHSRRVREPILCLAKHSETRSRVQDLLVQVRRRIARDANVVHLFEPHACRFETVANRLLGKTRAMLDAIEALFLSRGDQSTVFDDCRRSIAVVRVDSENVHRESIR